jgi:5-methylcytosine-specific restriction enzyme A
MPNAPRSWRPPGMPTPEQRAKQYDADRSRLQFRKWYTSARWKKERAVFLSIHPLCAECEQRGFTTAATIMDHKQPHRGDYDLFWSASNWNPLCASCHSKKTRRGE